MRRLPLGHSPQSTHAQKHANREDCRNRCQTSPLDSAHALQPFLQPRRPTCTQPRTKIDYTFDASTARKESPPVDAAIILPILLLVLACALFIFWPQRNIEAAATKTRADYLRERKDVVYENLRDLNFEYRAGKYPAEDYAEQRDALEAEAANVLVEIDHLEGRATRTAARIPSKSA
jgi:hypothetical protein